MIPKRNALSTTGLFHSTDDNDASPVVLLSTVKAVRSCLAPPLSTPVCIQHRLRHSSASHLWQMSPQPKRPIQTFYFRVLVYGLTKLAANRQVGEAASDKQELRSANLLLLVDRFWHSCSVDLPSRKRSRSFSASCLLRDRYALTAAFRSSAARPSSWGQLATSCSGSRQSLQHLVPLQDKPILLDRDSFQYFLATMRTEQGNRQAEQEIRPLHAGHK